MSGMTDVWVVTFNCGDYYCEGNHLVGIYSDEEEAAAVVARIQSLPLGALAELTYAHHQIDGAPDLSQMPA